MTLLNRVSSLLRNVHSHLTPIPFMQSSQRIAKLGKDAKVSFPEAPAPVELLQDDEQTPLPAK